MIDFYRRLGISPYEKSLAVIRRQIRRSSIDDSTVQAAKHILLSPQRKRIYDRTHSALSAIGRLRANLELVQSPGWLKSQVKDFSYKPDDSESEFDRWKPKSSKRDQRRSRKKQASSAQPSWNIVMGALVVAALFVAIFVIREVIIAESPNSSYSTTGSRARVAKSTKSAPVLLNDTNLLGDNRAKEIKGADIRYSTAENGAKNIKKARVLSLDEILALPSDGSRAKNLRSTDTKYSTPENRAKDIKSTGYQAGKREFHQPALPLPRTSLLWKFFNETTNLPPLKISTRSGNGNYYVKIVRHGSTIATLFIRDGETIETGLPTGLYEIKYANGAKWYGTEYCFGPSTLYARADKLFKFSVSGRELIGVEVQLIKQVGGNLETESIAVEDF